MSAVALARPPFPAVVDSTLLDHFRSCPTQCKLEGFDHFKPRARSVHLHAGAAYARGLEVTRQAYWERGASVDDAIGQGLRALIEAYGDFECPPDSAKSLERMCGAFEYHFHVYPLATENKIPHTFASGKRGIEFQFVEPLSIDHPETGDPLLYAGRFDQIVDFSGGVFGFDDKTASQLGASWPRQWELRSQFSAYTWGARRAGINMTGFIVRGISILKTKYETLEAITYRPAWMVDAWEQQTLRDLARMIQMWREGFWDQALGDACNAYGGCTFRKVCLASAEQRPVWLATDFERRRWDPVARVETVVEGAA